MKLLLDYLPITIFFIVYKMAPDLINSLEPYLSAEQTGTLRETNPLILATAVLIPCTVLQIVATRLIWGTVEKMHLVTLAIVVLLGGLTIAFNNKEFIQWKPTIVNWAFAAGFIGYRMFTGNHLLEKMMRGNLSLPDVIWRNLSVAWVLFFVLSGILNLFVAYNFSEDLWVDFKLFGMLGLTFVFIIAQGIYLSRYIKEDEESK